MSVCVRGCVCCCMSVCVCDCVLRFCLNYGNMPKICFSLWRLPSHLFSFAFSLCLLLVYGFYRASTLSLCCPLFWPIFRLLLFLLLSLWLRASNFKPAMKRLLYFIYNTYTYRYTLYVCYMLSFMQIFCCFLSGCIARCHIYLMVFLFLN